MNNLFLYCREEPKIYTINMTVNIQLKQEIKKQIIHKIT